MTTGNGEIVMEPHLEEFVFLARSHHRVQLLRELSREEQTRRELRTETGISQPTLGRILGDFEQRQWVSNQHNGAYALTPLGTQLADAVEDVLDVLGTIDQLTDIEDQLPWDRLGFEPHELSDAIITTPSSTEPLAHMRRFDELAAKATTVKVISNVVSCAPSHESTNADRKFLSYIDELVVTDQVIATGLNDPELAGWLRKRIEAEDLSLYSYDEEAAFLLGTFDDIVGIVPIDDAGMPCGLIEGTSEPIRAWGRDTFEEYRRSATRVPPDALEG